MISHPVLILLAAVGCLVILFWQYVLGIFRLLKMLICIKMHSYLHRSGTFSFLDVFEAKIDKCPPQKVQFISAETGEETTVTQVEQLANQVAHWGLKLGCKQLDTVALMMLNNPDFVSIWLGFGKIGVSTALLNTNAVGAALVHSCEVALANSQVKILIMDEELRSKLAADIKKVEELGVRVVYWNASRSGPVTAAVTNAIDFITQHVSIKQEVLTFPVTRLSKKHRDSVREKDTLMYIFTSGTTGLPKACKISHTKYYLASIPYAITCGLRKDDVIYTTMPLYHSAAGMLGVGAAISASCTLVIRKKFSASNFTADCLKYKATSVQYIGELCRYLLAQPANPDDDKLSIHTAFGNGLSPDIWLPFQKRFHIDHIVEFYGATEANAGLINNLDRVGALGFIPRIIDPIYPLKIVKTEKDDQTKPLIDKRTGRCVECTYNEVGLLIAQISKTSLDRRFDGYTDAKSTNSKILKDVFRKGDTYFNTGDLLSRDFLGFFYWSDRVGDTFRWKGENVATTEVSAAVSKSTTGVKDCVVYGVPVPKSDGKAGMAAIVLAESASADKALGEIAAYCKAHLPAYSRPLFIRVKGKGKKLATTATYKHVKNDLVKEAFDPAAVKAAEPSDELYYLEGDAYTALTDEAFAKITDKGVR